MLKYSVKLFASLKEKAGYDLWHYESEVVLKASALLTAFFEQHPNTANLRGVTRLAVNQSFCSEDLALAATDELALIPPVSGG